ncbi:hypothetical protein CI109_106347 [Kwoniella shandongensis]|uniref:Uncharacterized protein n=1 Tax=Kwoniella shandongensis TaxID=1734106 RepID=A0AAJ8LQ33_9TREE
MGSSKRSGSGSGSQPLVSQEDKWKKFFNVNWTDGNSGFNAIPKDSEVDEMTNMFSGTSTNDTRSNDQSSSTTSKRTSGGGGGGRGSTSSRR